MTTLNNTNQKLILETTRRDIFQRKLEPGIFFSISPISTVTKRKSGDELIYLVKNLTEFFIISLNHYVIIYIYTIFCTCINCKLVKKNNPITNPMDKNGLHSILLESCKNNSKILFT